jgi:ureidoglycolate lyase
MNLTVQELTAAGFAPFGEVIAQPDRQSDASGPGWQWWAETMLLPRDERPHSIGYLRLQPGNRRADWAERHMQSPEVVVPLGGDCLVYVGPPDHLEEPARLPALERFQVFRVRSGQGVVLRPGVWHGAPLALDAPLAALVLLLQGTGQTDKSLARFAHTPLDIHL